jgi:dihydrofolate synthase/folylpolyglutamate synthase
VTAHLATRVAVVTSVGDDHRDVLGPTLRDVAAHKAGILRRGAAAVSGVTGIGREVLRAEARALGVELREIRARGPVAARNLALAEAAVRAFGVEPPGGVVVPQFPGRLETIAEGPRVVLDIAHNPQKARGLVRSLRADGEVVLVLGALRGKNLAAMLRTLARRCRRVVFTTPDVTGKSAVPAQELRATYGPLFDEAREEPAPARALAAGLRLAGRRGTVLVTGSAYLVGALRGRWIPDRAVLLGRSSFPR